ncbi:MAG TPA: rhomboid family intramembrane serine protease [Acidimicrobiales bacterium]
MRQASVGFHCPECARGGQQKVVTARSLGTTPYVTAALIALNVVVFLIDLLSGTVDGLGELGADWALYGPLVGDGDWWRPVTAGFVHSGLIHIGFNMVLLYQLGLLLEPALGRVRFLALYFLSLLGGSFLVLVISWDQPTVGASGAVFGLMGAAVLAFRSRGIDPFSTGIPQLLGLNLLFTFVAARYISVGGHVGGLIAGLVGGWLLFELERTGPIGKTVGTVLCGVLAAGLFAGCLYLGSNPV